MRKTLQFEIIVDYIINQEDFTYFLLKCNILSRGIRIKVHTFF
jgi:hypothetical protein